LIDAFDDAYLLLDVDYLDKLYFCFLHGVPVVELSVFILVAPHDLQQAVLEFFYQQFGHQQIALL
jgi:hypothetical protein